MSTQGKKVNTRWAAHFNDDRPTGAAANSGIGATEKDVIDSVNLPKTAAAGTAVADRIHITLGGNTSALVKTGLPGTVVQYANALYTRASMDRRDLFIPIADGKKMRVIGTSAAPNENGTGCFEGFALYPANAMGAKKLIIGTDVTVTGGNPCVFTMAAGHPHPLVSGDRIRIVDNTSDVNELQVNNGAFTVFDVTETTFKVQADIAGPVQDGEIHCVGRAFPTISNEGALLCEERAANNTDLYTSVARIEPGERILITGIHMARQEADNTRWCELYLTPAITIGGGIITAPADATIDYQRIARQSTVPLFLDCHIEIGGNYRFDDGAGNIRSGANGSWLIFRNKDDVGGGANVDAHCLIKFTKLRGSMPNKSAWKFDSVTTAASTVTKAIYTVPVGKRFVVRHAMVDNVAQTSSAMWYTPLDAPGTFFSIIGSTSGITQAKPNLVINGATAGAQIHFGANGTGDARCYFDGFYL